jgi:hypothetical protein
MRATRLTDLMSKKDRVALDPSESGPNAGNSPPPDPSHLEKLKWLNLIEMQDKEPTLTRAGHDALS